MKVAVLVRRWGAGGGSERSALALSRHLIELGHDVHVYCQKVDPAAGVELAEGRLHRLPGVGFDPTLSMLSFERACNKAVLGLRTRGQGHVVIGFDHSTLQDVYRLGRGVHAEFMDRLAAGIGLVAGGPVLDRAALALERRRFGQGRFGRLVAVSQRVADDVVRHYPSTAGRVTVVRNGVDLDRFGPQGPAGERSQVRARWGVGEADPVLLLVGRNPRLKGLDLAEAAAAEVGCKLVYVGDPPPGPGAGAIWDGPQDDIASCYRAADLLIQPSRYEAFGNAALEAAACGCPVVARDDMGSTELFAGTLAARLLVVDPTDAHALVAAVRHGLDPDAAPGLRAAALTVARGAGAAGWAAEMAAVLQEMAAESPAP